MEMRLVATSRVDEGAVLARDVLTGNPGELPLLRAGVKMTARYRDALIETGIHALYIDDDLGADIKVTRALSDRTREAASQALARSFEEVPQALRGGGPLSDKTIADLQQVAALICDDLAAADDAVLAFSDLAAADSYTLQHSIDVTAVGILIAQRHFHERGRRDYRGKRRWDRIPEYIAKLGVGLLLHDIGKLAVPKSIVMKPGALTDEEQEIMRKHPLLGLEMLPGDMIGPLAKSVVRSHHERFDGTGYPYGQSGDSISEFARIASVADVFDAVTSARPYRDAAPPHVGVQTVRQGSGTQFDPQIVKTFSQVVAPYPPGHEVTLTDGRRGVVVSVPPFAADRPVVRVGWNEAGERVDPYEIDIAKDPQLLPMAGGGAEAAA
jgi:HD-GYP domain-containing protein (c-di-GMP phosphodiesterase class II)